VLSGLQNLLTTNELLNATRSSNDDFIVVDPNFECCILSNVIDVKDFRRALVTCDSYHTAVKNFSRDSAIADK
jgi:hypothetical protein